MYDYNHFVDNENVLCVVLDREMDNRHVYSLPMPNQKGDCTLKTYEYLISFESFASDMCRFSMRICMHLHVGRTHIDSITFGLKCGSTMSFGYELRMEVYVAVLA